MKKIKIGNKLVGENKPCFIVAEAGVNHNGKLDLAKKLIDVAKEAGADAVKFQTFKAGGVVIKDAGIANYAKKNIGKDMKQIEMIKELELKYEDFVELKNYCDRKGIMFLSTPHSEDAVDFLEPLVPAYKIGSGDLTNIPFLVRVAKKGKPIILSTGMSTLEEVKEAVKAIKNAGNDKIILLHCTTSYPCSIEDVNLRAMQTMQKEFNCLIGYSDHTLGVQVSLAAVALGAKVIEKHFTLDKNLPGSDHKASLEPSELKDLVHEVRTAEKRLKEDEKPESILKTIPNIEKILGSKMKKPTPSEVEIAKIVRKSVVAEKSIPAETEIKGDMLAIKRPGTGLPPNYLEKIIGKKAKRDIQKGEIITWDKIK
jgi:N-acetylneuraminate synthase/N,N'-diacetyllegionaminate synthase